MRYKILLGLIILTLVCCCSSEKNIDIDGHYERFIGNSLDIHHAFLDVSKQHGEHYLISGIATWQGNVTIGNVNMGEIEGLFTLQDRKFNYDLNGCQLLITLADNALLVSEASDSCGGLNVSFNGYYKKTS